MCKFCPVCDVSGKLCFHIRSDSFFVDIIALWRKIFCDGDLYRTAIGKRLDGLHHALPIGSCSYNRSNPVVLYRPRKDLRCTGTVSVYQNSQRHVQFIFSVAGFLFPLSVFVLCIDDQSFRKYLAEYAADCSKKASRIITEIHNQLLHSLFLQICKCFFILIAGHLRKFGDPDIAGVSGKHLMGNRLDLHIPDLHFDIPGFLFVFPLYGQHYGIFLTVTDHGSNIGSFFVCNISSIYCLDHISLFQSRLFSRATLIKLYDLCPSGVILLKNGTDPYVGIGAVLQKDDTGGAKIIQLYEGGPGEQAGLKKGDVIKAVDGADVTDKETSDIAAMVRDSEKDSVMLTIQRENEEKTRDVKVEIRDVEIQTVSHEMLSGDTGYIRISEFSEVTSDQYKKAFADLKEQGMKKLVVDLRDNPGGLLTAVCGVLRQILPEGLIVYTEDKNGKREEETCDGKNELDMPLAVLVNGNSASASEIFAGAVKDYGIGTIVGTTTYGKGVVQTIQPLTDGSAVKITIAKYFTPKGNDINKKGITPDVEAELSGDITDWTELTHKEDAQLQTALKEIGQS